MVVLRLLAVLLAALVMDRVAGAVLLERDSRGRQHVRGRYVAPFRAPVLQHVLAASVERLRAEGDGALVELAFDADLGWEPRAARGDLAYGVDALGARVDGRSHGAQPAPGVRRVAAFGCSFTYGSEVRGDEAWPAVLDAARADLEVLNFGVPAYGLDQALQRLERHLPVLAADEVWFALMPGAAQRPTTHFPAYVHPWTGAAWFKPRVELSPDGALRRLPNPVTSLAETLAAYDEPGRFSALLAGRDPWFDALAPAFQERPEHLLFVGRLYWTWRVARLAREHQGEWPDGRSLVPLHVALALAARDAAVAEGAVFRYLVLPNAQDLPPPHGRGSRFAAELAGELRRAGVEVLEFDEAVLAVPHDRRWAPGGHYSPATNAAVAGALAARLP